MKVLVLLCVFLLVPFVSGATVYGTIYDLELVEQKDTIVTINTLPEQTFVAKNATYAFELDPGEYSITARKGTLTDEAQVIVQDDKSYVVDLILIPDIDDELELFDQDITFEAQVDDDTKSSATLFIALAAIFVVVTLAIFLWPRKQKNLAVEDLADEVLSFIKSQDGRTTQKEIRKQFPLSEAKISLVLTELEAKGKVQKIKKGKGNIVVLK